MVFYFGGRGTWLPNFDDYRMGGREYTCYIVTSVSWSYFLPRKIVYCTNFMENILSSIVQHVLNSNMNIFPKKGHGLGHVTFLKF